MELLVTGLGEDHYCDLFPTSTVFENKLPCLPVEIGHSFSESVTRRLICPNPVGADRR